MISQCRSLRTLPAEDAIPPQCICLGRPDKAAYAEATAKGVDGKRMFLLGQLSLVVLVVLKIGLSDLRTFFCLKEIVYPQDDLNLEEGQAARLYSLDSDAPQEHLKKGWV